MSYHARMRMPPLMVTGRTGACGNMKRQDFSICGTSCGTTGSKSWPSAPSPCSQMMAALGLGAVSTSMVSNMGR
jgi:hypothetical protein